MRNFQLSNTDGAVQKQTWAYLLGYRRCRDLQDYPNQAAGYQTVFKEIRKFYRTISGNVLGQKKGVARHDKGWQPLNIRWSRRGKLNSCKMGNKPQLSLNPSLKLFGADKIFNSPCDSQSDIHPKVSLLGERIAR